MNHQLFGCPNEFGAKHRASEAHIVNNRPCYRMLSKPLQKHPRGPSAADNTNMSRRKWRSQRPGDESTGPWPHPGQVNPNIPLEDIGWVREELIRTTAVPLDKADSTYTTPSRMKDRNQSLAEVEVYRYMVHEWRVGHFHSVRHGPQSRNSDFAAAYRAHLKMFDDRLGPEPVHRVAISMKGGDHPLMTPEHLQCHICEFDFECKKDLLLHLLTEEHEVAFGMSPYNCPTCHVPIEGHLWDHYASTPHHQARFEVLCDLGLVGCDSDDSG